MKILIATALVLNISFAAVVDDYLSSLKEEALKTNPDFKEKNRGYTERLEFITGRV